MTFQKGFKFKIDPMCAVHMSNKSLLSLVMSKFNAIVFVCFLRRGAINENASIKNVRLFVFPCPLCLILTNVKAYCKAFL